MDAKLRKKLRSTVKQISADMKKDPKLRKQFKKKHVRVLAERGKLNLSEIIAAHDLFGCNALTMSG